MPLDKYLKTHYSPRTVKSYEREISIFLMNYPQAETSSYKELVHYVGRLRERYKNRNNLSRIVSSIKVYYRYLQETQKREDNPSSSLRLRDRPSKDIQLQDLFTEQELAKLLERVERYKVLGNRNKVLLSLLIYQGLRPEEVASLRIEDIHLEQGTVAIGSSRKRNARVLALQPMQILLFYQYETVTRQSLLKGQDSPQYLIGHRGKGMQAEEITKHVKRLYKGVYGSRKVNCQTIRQSVITNLLKKGKDLRVVQEFAGHKYPSSTEKYKQTNVEALQTAINQYHPMQKKKC